MSLNIQKTSEIKVNKLSVLVYGPPGSGKTRFSGTCKPRFNPLILSAESGLLSLKNLKDEKGVPFNFDYLQIDQFEQIEEARNFLRHGQHRYDTVIIDSITEIQQSCMDSILRQEKIPKARIQDWGTLAQKMITVIRDFRDMERINLIATALSETVADEETGTSRTIPLVQGQLKEKLAGYFDEVFYMYSKSVKDAQGAIKVERMLVTQGTQRTLAKDRSGLLPPTTAPDFSQVHALIFGSETTKLQEDIR